MVIYVICQVSTNRIVMFCTVESTRSTLKFDAPQTSIKYCE